MSTSGAKNNKTMCVRIELYASKLKNIAGAFKGTSDPYAVVALLPNNTTEMPRILGITEVIQNSLNPHWTKYFDVNYQLGQATRFHVGVYDETRQAKQNMPMGSATFEVGEILGSRGNIKATRLRLGGVLFVRVTTAPKSHGLLHLGLRGIGLPNLENMFNGKSDPFIEISARVDIPPNAVSWQTVFRSKQIMNDLNPIWPDFSLDMGRLCAGDQDRPIQFEVYDWEKSGKHKRIGRVQTTVRALLEAEAPSAAGAPNKNLVNHRGFVLRSQEKKDRGKVVVTKAQLERNANTSLRPMMANDEDIPKQPSHGHVLNHNITPTFVDYMAGGCELELTIAIDFTASNGDPRQPGTLHYMHRDGVSLNDYEKAFTSVGSIIAKFDSNQQFPVWGFGAKYGGVIKHCFQVGNKPEVQGIGEALQAYRHVFQSGLIMSGPTVFAECIDMAAQRARSAQQQAERIGKQTYGILLILTDGVVSDVELTKRSLRDASDAPLSIVIVGLGSADFSTMQFLDDFANADPNQRDIVQFVEFNKFAHDKSALTRETLDEIPGQLVDYFYNSRRIPPLPPPEHGSQLDSQGKEPTDQDVDMSIVYNSKNEIVLGCASNLPSYDDTQYHNATAFLVPVVPVPVPLQPGFVNQWLVASHNIMVVALIFLCCVCSIFMA